MLLNAFCVVRSRVMSHGRKTGTTAIVPLCTATDLPPNGLYRFVSTKIRASLMSNTPQSDDLSNASVAYDTKESAYFASDFDEEVIDVDKELEQEVNNRRQLLKATLKHVPTLGWTAHAIVSGAKDLGLSPSSIGLFEGGTLGLVAEYIRYNNEKLEQAAKSIKLSGSTRDKYYSLIKARLELQVPYMSNWQQGLGHLVCPSNIKVSAPLLLETADSICYSAGDRSSDVSRNQSVTTRVASAYLSEVFTSTFEHCFIFALDVMVHKARRSISHLCIDRTVHAHRPIKWISRHLEVSESSLG
eukprot:TRINITY_DN3880_c0_g1_i1.p1 TRINITY_DN3880_c0_g1~~TRINITY_DN3880_c0_g1_i1.p1  ORF type:complete len:301 (-),score=53.22 TRINITY_DN3880_c0_g1_i1:199-1101(-)